MERECAGLDALRDNLADVRSGEGERERARAHERAFESRTVNHR